MKIAGTEPVQTKGRAIVAMSGGVDSSVVAAMMHAEGWEVIGIAMRLYADQRKTLKSCCSPDDLRDARAVAAAAGFPFYIANYQEEFKRRIIDTFVDDYRRGRTPSPCILCNNHLKFSILFERAELLEADCLATGHYARIEDRGGRLALLRGHDTLKDQSYFLFGLPRHLLSKVRFPLGAMDKDQVRTLGRELEVPTSDKAESQDLCFVNGADYASFVQERLREDEIRSGEIVEIDSNEVLGSHSGIHQFTVGQRRGLGISYPEPLYVKSIDPETGTVWVGTRERAVGDRFFVERLNWLRWEEPPASFHATVQVRYRQRPVECFVRMEGEGAWVELSSPLGGIAPGQAAVFFDEDEVLGGGWIERAP